MATVPTKEEAAVTMAMAIRSAMEGIPIELYALQSAYEGSAPRFKRELQAYRYLPEFLKGSGQYYMDMFEVLGGTKSKFDADQDAEDRFEALRDEMLLEQAVLDEEIVEDMIQDRVDMQNIVAGYEYVRKNPGKLKQFEGKSIEQISKMLEDVVIDTGGMLPREIDNPMTNAGYLGTIYPSSLTRKFAKKSHELLDPESETAQMSDEEFDKFLERRVIGYPMYSEPTAAPNQKMMTGSGDDALRYLLGGDDIKSEGVRLITDTGVIEYPPMTEEQYFNLSEEEQKEYDRLLREAQEMQKQKK